MKMQEKLETESVTLTEPKSRSKRALIVFGCVLVIGVIIGLAVYFTTTGDGDSIVTEEVKEDADHDKDVVTGELIDCHPQSGATQEVCAQRGVAEEEKEDADHDQGVVSGELIDCHPQSGATQEICALRGCLWREQSVKDAPWCIYPEGHGYLLKGEIEVTPSGLSAEVTRINTNTIYKGDHYDQLTVNVEYQTSSRLRVKISPTDVTRYEVPEEALSITSPTSPPAAEDQLYEVSMVKGPPQFGVVVKRKDSNTTIFSTSVPGFTFSDQFIQITTRLPSANLYGFGEHNHRQFKHDMNWKTWSIFTRDSGVWGSENLYGAHPVYMNIEEDGKATMVLLKNSNAMEVSLTPNPHPAVTYRVIGGVLDFYIFMGPTPEQAVSQYLEAVGKPVMPPYWALGFHLCRWGYKDLDDMKMVMERNRAAGIPYDVQWGDIEYMYKKYLFTVDRKDWKELPQVVDDLHQNDQRFVVIVDPGVGADPAIIDEAKRNSPGFDMFADGVRQDIFVKNASGDVLVAKVWPGLTVYPDFTNPKTENYWLKWMRYFHDNESIKYDALWIDMNEPASFVPGSIYGCENTTWDYPPYVPNILGAQPEGRMFDKTLCMTSQQHWGKHYDVHSLYAHSHAIQTFNALMKQKPEIRPWTMTRSSFVGTGKYATKWMGDNQSRWPQLHWSIVGIMEFSMFGFAMNGADICGFWDEAEYEMCIRWHQLGAFYPFSRNHNGKGDYPVLFKHQDPAGWDQRFIDIVKPVLMTRYRLLPYLYTLMFKAHQYGHMVMKALLFEFPMDKSTWTIDRQFLLGPALLLSPALEQNQTIVEAYFPEARWYNYMTGEEVVKTGKYHNLYTPLDKYNLHIRGGYVIPVQEPATTTVQSRKNPLGLLITLDENYLANGELFLDDGESYETYVNKKSTLVKFRMLKAGKLTISTEFNYYKPASRINIKTVEIYGLSKIPNIVLVNGTRVHNSYIRQSGKIIQILDQSIPITDDSTIKWTIY